MKNTISFTYKNQTEECPVSIAKAWYIFEHNKFNLAIHVKGKPTVDEYGYDITQSVISESLILPITSINELCSLIINDEHDPWGNSRFVEEGQEPITDNIIKFTKDELNQYFLSWEAEEGNMKINIKTKIDLKEGHFEFLTEKDLTIRCT